MGTKKTFWINRRKPELGKVTVEFDDDFESRQAGKIFVGVLFWAIVSSCALIVLAVACTQYIENGGIELW